MSANVHRLSKDLSEPDARRVVGKPPVACGRCKSLISPIAAYCPRCGVLLLSRRAEEYRSELIRRRNYERQKLALAFHVPFLVASGTGAVVLLISGFRSSESLFSPGPVGAVCYWWSFGLFVLSVLGLVGLAVYDWRALREHRREWLRKVWWCSPGYY